MKRLLQRIINFRSNQCKLTKAWVLTNGTSMIESGGAKLLDTSTKWRVGKVFGLGLRRISISRNLQLKDRTLGFTNSQITTKLILKIHHFFVRQFQRRKNMFAKQKIWAWTMSWIITKSWGKVKNNLYLGTLKWQRVLALTMRHN